MNNRSLSIPQIYLIPSAVIYISYLVLQGKGKGKGKGSHCALDSQEYELRNERKRVRGRTIMYRIDLKMKTSQSTGDYELHKYVREAVHRHCDDRN